MSYETILFETGNGIATLTLNRPDVFNAFDEQQSYDVIDALKKTGKDKSIRVLIMTGSGKAFCSGQDLKSISGAKNRSLSDSIYKRYNPMIKAIRNLPVPVICKLLILLSLPKMQHSLKFLSMLDWCWIQAPPIFSQDWWVQTGHSK